MRYRIYKLINEQDLLEIPQKDFGGCSRLPIFITEANTADVEKEKEAIRAIEILKDNYGGEYTFLPVI